VTLEEFTKRFKRWHKHPLLAHLGVGHFECEGLLVTDTPFGEESSCASVRIDGLYDSFRVEIRTDWLRGATPEEADRVAVHELLHVVMRDLDTAYKQITETAGSTDSEDWYNHEKEGLIDRVARTIVALDNASIPSELW
jgi:hypothetical protein